MSQQWSESEARATPVADACLWCKCSVPEAVRVPVGDDEYLCPVCLGDLRYWKRYQKTELFYVPSLEPTVKRIVADHWDAIRSDLLATHAGDPDLFPLPRRKANATTHEPYRDSLES